MKQTLVAAAYAVGAALDARKRFERRMAAHKAALAELQTELDRNDMAAEWALSRYNRPRGDTHAERVACKRAAERTIDELGPAYRVISDMIRRRHAARDADLAAAQPAWREPYEPKPLAPELVRAYQGTTPHRRPNSNLDRRIIF